MKYKFCQFSVGEDWYTIARKAENLYKVSRKGSGDYETYEADEEAVENLMVQATSEII